MTIYWQISEEWPGATAFIIAGGPSLKSVDLSALQGQKVIAINGSYQIAPFADFLIFSDFNWWDHYKDKLGSFAGRMVCCSRTPLDNRLLMVRRKVPPGLDQPNDCLPVQFTTTTGAMVLAVKLGAKKLVLLGVDGRIDEDGSTHHYKINPFKLNDNWRIKQRGDLVKMVAPLKERRIEVVLATPSDYEDLWPRVELADLLPHEEVQEDETNIDQGPVGSW